MAVIPEKVVETVEEIMRIFKSLPPRPTIEEVEAAATVIKSVNADEETRLAEIDRRQAPTEIPRELFGVLQEVRRNEVRVRSFEQKREALHVVEVDRMFQIFDDLIQRASDIVSGHGDPGPRVAAISAAPIKDESVVSAARVKKSAVRGESVEFESVERNGGPKVLERSSSAKASLFAGSFRFISLMEDYALLWITAADYFIS